MSKAASLLAGAAVGLVVVFAYTAIIRPKPDVEQEESIDGSQDGLDRVGATLGNDDALRDDDTPLVQTRGSGSHVPLGNVVGDKESQNLLNLLYTIAEDQARREGYAHRGLTCNVCQMSPIRGARYKCASCADVDLCEACEAQSRHDKAHVLLKIRIPIPPLANPRTALLPVFYPGGKSTSQASLTPSLLEELQKETHYDQVELEALFEQFKSLSNDGGIDRNTFETCLGPLAADRNLITERIFHFFDQNGDNLIDFKELVCGLSVLCKGSQEEKIAYAFRGYDLDNSGFIGRNELQKMFKAYFYLSIELVRDVIKAMEEEMMASFDDEGGKPVSSVFTAPIPREITHTPSTKEHTEHLEDPFDLFPGQPSNPINSDHNTPGSPEMISSQRRVGFHSSDCGLPRARQSSIGGDDRPGASAQDRITEFRRESSTQSSHLFTHFSRPMTRRSSTAVAERFEKGESWPVMEAMSQDAIEEIVERTFSGADLDGDGVLSYDEFVKWSEKDATMTAWFDALGSVF